jgi:hypothetical protein
MGSALWNPGMLNEVIYVKMKKETDELKALVQENRRLKIALTDMTLTYDVLETLLEVAGINREALKSIELPTLGAITKKVGNV